jgi:hypothetical protein
LTRISSFPLILLQRVQGFVISQGGVLIFYKWLARYLREPFGPRSLDDVGGVDGGTSFTALVSVLLEPGQRRGDLALSCS